MSLIQKPNQKTSFTTQLEHQRLTSLINSMADAVIALDNQANVVLYNGASLNILDINNIKPGSALKSIFRPIDQNSQPFDITSFVRTTKKPTTNRDLRLKYHDGSEVNLYLSVAPVRLGYRQKGHHGFVLLLRDITHEKSLEEERDEFISVVSHELRTPVAIAEGNISNAQLSADAMDGNASIKKSLREAHNQVLFLADMINDLSTLSRAESGKLKLGIEQINISSLVREVVDGYVSQAVEKGLKINVSIDPKLELLQSSPLYVTEILQNLITNALKYTDRGQIQVSATTASQGAKLVVTDSGIGISKVDQARVFDKFFRSNDSRIRKVHGSGLGLYVTSKLARLINAELDLESELNHGSKFTVYLPNLK